MSWVPIINNVAAVFGGIGIVFGLIAIFRNRKNKKIISIIAVILSIASVAIVLITQSMYSSAINEISDSMDRAASSQEAEFTWTKEGYDALVVGDTITGVGGATFDDIVAQFGEPGSSNESQSGDYTTKYASWDNGFGSDGYKSVDLSFTKQEDGTFLLNSKSQSGLE
ncbi:MAG: DUF4190 domain-containing protein [Streptococcaceae bacterium]|nr:DUF4190 domain-containing protein [Streptococcaceae bacterium]